MRIKYISLLTASLAIWACTSHSPQSEDEVFTPDWKTHAHDSEVLNSSPVENNFSKLDNTQHSQELEIKQFATINHRTLGRELAKRKGPTLNGLLKLLKVNSRYRSKNIQRIYYIYRRNRSADKFAEALWQWHNTKPQ